MIKQIFPKLMVAFLATAMLAACSNKAQDEGVVITDAEMTTTQREDVTTFDDGFDQEVTTTTTTGPAPGTQQDFVVNVGDRVFFGTDQHDLSMEARNVLERQAGWLRQYPNIRVTIEGHADERGTREYNLALGERRAQSVRSYLTALGIDGSRITTISYGKERPAVVGTGPEVWAQNRRSVTVVE
tara:strand:+ start:1015 stop:1569 length:555 start_codon:yes stop_codon:yes gene_type:complete